ncbi:MAG: tRNA lysidine(34) synthetase TilS [Caldiserica bacterium]|nr:tRNA lysidine(34) synthetase TilS [Caldisericota bacterium]
MGMFERVRDEVRRRGLLSPGDHVLVAVSGGPDSMALLYCLWWLRRDYDLSLTIAHLDHGIRPDTGKDLEAVRWAAEDLGLPLVHGRRDVPAFARERKLNLEEAARIARREFLERAAEEAGASKIALGHTRTDLAETVLMHLLRGAGPGGLRGILFSAPPYIRPLLCVSRRETEEFCRAHDIPYVIDPTNLDTKLLRNAIRLELLPYLERFAPDPEGALARSAELWAEAEEALGWAADRALQEARLGDRALSVGRLMEMPRSVRALAVRAMAAEVLGSERGIDRVHIEQVLHILEVEEGHAMATLPKGLLVERWRDRLRFVLAPPGPGREAPPEGEWELPLPGEREIPELGWRFRLSLIPRPADLRPPSPYVAYIDPRKIAPPLRVRTRRPGDRIRPLGFPEAKKLKDLLSSAGIPPEERDRVPLLCDKKGIIWAVGARLSEDYKVEGDATEVLRVEAERLK